MGCGGAITAGHKPTIIKNTYPTCKMTLPLSLEVDSIAAYNDNTIILGCKGELQLYDLSKKSTSLISKDHPNRINCLLKLKNGTIVSAGQDSTIRLWNIEKNECIGTLTGHTSYLWVINELKNNKLISGSDDRQCKVWDLKNMKEDFTLFKSHREISTVIQLQNEKILLCTGKQLLLFNLSTKNQESCMELKGGAWVLKELSNGDVIAGQGKGNIVVIYYKEGELKIKTTFKKYHTKTVTFCIELDNHKIVTASDENDIVIWDLSDLDSMYVMRSHTDAITGLTHISGTSFATVSRDNTLKIWG